MLVRPETTTETKNTPARATTSKATPKAAARTQSASSERGGSKGEASSPPLILEPRDSVSLGYGNRVEGEDNWLKKPGQILAAIAKAAAPAATSVSRPKFDHTPVHPRNLSRAQDWKPGSPFLSPSAANQQINKDYHALNGSMQNYLKGDPNKDKLPDVPDWMSFGKYASREAGEQIRNLQNMQSALNFDTEAATDLARDGANPDAIKQAASMGWDTVKRGWDGDNLLGAPGDMLGKLDKLSKALVKGNTEIHNSIAPAYDAFLTGESNGEGGLKRLHDAGYTRGSEKDPQGFINTAFESYRQARELGLAAQNSPSQESKAGLLEQRRQLLEKGNLMLGIQEQMEILQQKEIYGDSDVQTALGSVAGMMTVTDAVGKHAVGSRDKDWTNFADRMGFQTVSAETPGAIAVRDKQGVTSHYLPDASQSGSIVEYFSRASKGDAAAQRLTRDLNASQAREIESQPSNMFSTKIDQLGRGANSVRESVSNNWNWALDALTF